LASLAPAELVERLWARDATLWTGRDENRWLGWLDEPLRMRQRVAELEEFAATTVGRFDSVVLLGMGGSSLAPEVLRRTFESDRLQVLDTTHPAAVRRAAESLDPARTLFLVSSKSGTTLETRCHLDFFWDWAGGRADSFAAITDPGSELESLARKRGFRAVFAGEPTIGGRYSALSAFGLVPAALIGVDLERFLLRVEEMVEACHLDDGNPGLELGERMGEGWKNGRDKVQVSPLRGGFGLWVEQLIAESTGKQGKGLVPVPVDEPADGPDRQSEEARVGDPYELGQEFYRWEFATAVAGAIIGINPFDQPNVQAAKDRTNEVLSDHDRGQTPDMAGSVDELLEAASPPDYVCIQAFIDPAGEAELAPLIARAALTGCVVTHGLGPRYLHSTGQLHKGGPPEGRFIQVVDDPGDELAIPDRPFGFGTLIRAQADGDLASLRERGRPIVRVNLEEVAS
jgi:transaldolase/glucose-6-phosphate isomerase